MSLEAYIGDISIVAFDFAPKNWATCSGQLLPIAQNQALFSILGTTYGGNGTTNFQLPNFQGKTPVHVGQGFGQHFSLGQTGGEYAHTLTNSEMPAHQHLVSNAGVVKAKTGPLADQTSPVNNYFATNAAETKRFTAVPDTTMGTISSLTTATAGSSIPHENMQPYLVLNFVICLYGMFPSRN